MDIGLVPLRGEIALRVARQAGAHISVAGILQHSSGSFDVQLNARRSDSGKSVANVEDHVPDRSELSSASERLGIELHRALFGGDPQPKLGPASASTDALEQFVSGLEFYQHGDVGVALAQLTNAAQLDREFALAFVYLSIVHNALKREHLAFDAAQRAFALSHRLNRRQRLQAEAAYAKACGDFRKALDLEQILVATYPGEAQLHRHIAHTYTLLEDLEPAVQHAEEAVERDKRSALNRMIYASLLAQTGRADKAHDVLKEGRRHDLNSPLLMSSEAMVRIMQDDTPAAIPILDQLGRRPGLSGHTRALRIRGLLMAGNLTEARVRLESDLLANQAEGDVANEDLSRYWLAQILNLEGDINAVEGHARALAGRPAEPFSLFSLRYAVECACDARLGEVLEIARENWIALPPCTRALVRAATLNMREHCRPLARAGSQMRESSWSRHTRFGPI